MNNKKTNWKEFIIGDTFKLTNSTAYHKSDVIEAKNKYGLPYITRTSLNNGIEMQVEEETNFNINAGNQIVFGAENADFFFQEYPFITGNKMYLLNHEMLNKTNGLFIINALRSAIKGNGFGYSLGMTATRLSKKKVLLPIDNNNKLNWNYMQEIGKLIYKQQNSNLLNYITQKKNSLAKELDLFEKIKLIDTNWQSFQINEILNIKSGVRLTKKDQEPGTIPFIGATEYNNGITNFVSNTNNSLDSNILGVNYNGTVVESFYHEYEAVFSDDVKRMELKISEYRNKYVYLFLATMIEKQKEKYRYNYKFNAGRMKKQYILLPIDENKQINWKYMELYMKKIEYKKLEKLINYLENKK